MLGYHLCKESHNFLQKIIGKGIAKGIPSPIKVFNLQQTSSIHQIHYVFSFGETDFDGSFNMVVGIQKIVFVCSQTGVPCAGYYCN